MNSHSISWRLFNIIFQSTASSSKCCLSLSFPNHFATCFRLRTCPTPRPSHRSWFYLPIAIWWSLQTVTGLQSADFVARMPTGVVIHVARSDGIRQNANECEHLKCVFPLYTQETHQNWDHAFWQEEFLLFRYLVRWRNLPPVQIDLFWSRIRTKRMFYLCYKE